MQRLQNNLLASVAAVSLKLTKMNTVSDNADITKQSIIAYALIVGITHMIGEVSRMISVLLILIIIAGICGLLLYAGHLVCELFCEVIDLTHDGGADDGNSV